MAVRETKAPYKRDGVWYKEIDFGDGRGARVVRDTRRNKEPLTEAQKRRVAPIMKYQMKRHPRGKASTVLVPRKNKSTGKIQYYEMNTKTRKIATRPYKD